MSMTDFINAEIREGLRLMRKVVDDPSSLKLGQHIYCYKRSGCYSHHGIYAGDGKVIHFTRTQAKESFLPSSLLPTDEQEHPSPCENCYRLQIPDQDVNWTHGVIMTCLDCFRRDGSNLQPLHLYVYGVHRLWFSLKVSGSCTATAATKSLSEAAETAYGLLRDRSFGEYNLLFNNCEHFVTFCHTGVRISEQTVVWARCYTRMYRMRECCFISNCNSVIVPAQTGGPIDETYPISG